MGQVIDFALVRNCTATAETRGRFGSDHELVEIIVAVPLPGGRTRTLRLALWNVRRDRPEKVVRETLRELLDGAPDRLPYDVLLLVETDGYKRVVRSLEEYGHTAILYDAEPGQANTSIVVRAGLDTSRHHCKRMTRRGWVTVRGGRTPAKWLPSALVAGLLRVSVGHPAPSVDSVQTARGLFELVGPALRIASTVAWMRSGRDWWRNRSPHRAAVMAADFNEPPSSRGRHTPRWLAEQSRAHVVAPSTPTHGHRR